jgi:hypothetical protein
LYTNNPFSAVFLFVLNIESLKNRATLNQSKEKTTMKKLCLFALMGVCLVFGMAMAHAGEKASRTVVNLAESKLVALGMDQVIVDAVKRVNKQNKTLDQIKAMDERWKAHAGIADYMQALIDSACGRHLREIQGKKPYLAEIFVMDNQGANVAMTDKTSDYWQGDEAKFKNAFNNGKGAVFVDEVEFDDSTQTYLVQVSVPVKDGNAVIGAITFGIDVDQVQ